MTPTEALALNMVPLTMPYEPDQRWMAEAALTNLKAGGIVCALIEVQDGVEVWRTRPASPQRSPVRGRDLGYNMLRS